MSSAGSPAPSRSLLGDIAVLGAGAPAGTVRVGLALHSLRAVPPDALAIAVEAARGMDPIDSDPHPCGRAGAGSPAFSGVDWRASPSHGSSTTPPWTRHWCLIHATHLDEHEVQRMAATGAVVGLCPTTEANLGDGVFPLSAFQEHAGRWAVGTDSHVGRGPAGELRMLEYGQRLHTRRRNVVAGPHHRSSARAMLEAAWRGGASASGRRIGALTPRRPGGRRCARSRPSGSSRAVRGRRSGLLDLLRRRHAGA